MKILIAINVLLIIAVGWLSYLWNVDVRSERERLTYIGDRITDDAVLSEGQKALRWKKFAAKVIGIYSPSNYSIMMKKEKQAEFINAMYRATVLLDLPPMALLAIGTMESGFNPHVVGGIGEVGIYQHHSTVIPCIVYFMQLLRATSPAVAAEVDPMIVRHEDLKCPIKSVRSQAVILWGLRREYSDELYWISASHWGSHRVDPWARARIEPKEYYVFNRKNPRYPLQYYYHYKRIETNFVRWNPDLGKYLDEYAAYRSAASKVEREYIDTREYITRLVKAISKAEENAKALSDGVKELQDLKSKVGRVDSEYRKIYADVKRKRTSYDKAYDKSREIFERFIEDVKK